MFDGIEDSSFSTPKHPYFGTARAAFNLTCLPRDIKTRILQASDLKTILVSSKNKTFCNSYITSLYWFYFFLTFLIHVAEFAIEALEKLPLDYFHKFQIKIVVFFCHSSSRTSCRPFYRVSNLLWTHLSLVEENEALNRY